MIPEILVVILLEMVQLVRAEHSRQAMPRKRLRDDMAMRWHSFLLYTCVRLKLAKFRSLVSFPHCYSMLFDVAVGMAC